MVVHGCPDAFHGLGGVGCTGGCWCLVGVGCGASCCMWGCCICLSAGKSFIFIPARCFFDPFCACFCASCSIDCGFFCVVGGRRFVEGVGWFGLARWRVV